MRFQDLPKFVINLETRPENLENKHAKSMFKDVYIYSDINKRAINNINLSLS